MRMESEQGKGAAGAVNNAELKAALLSGEPVMRMGTRYSCVSGIIYRAYRGEIYIQAELRDCASHSVIIVHAKEVQRIAANKEEPPQGG